MKKLVSIILCVLLIIGSISVASSAATTQKSLKQAIELYETQTGETVNTKRYYFLMPNGSNGEKGDDEDWFFYDEYIPSWYNTNANWAGVWWWDTGKVDPDNWPGFKMMKGDSDSVFYADIPDFVECVVFNNYFDGGYDPNDPIYNDAFQCRETYLSGYEPGESELYPDGLETTENMIFVLDPNIYMLGDSSQVGEIWWGEWFYYYGNGCYGTVKDGNEHNCLRDDHDHENLYINFDPSNAGWTEYENIYCRFAREGQASAYPVTSVPSLCTDYDGDGVYTYDLNKSKISIEQYTKYEVQFYTDNHKHTASLLMQKGNLKDTIYATGEYYQWDNYKENPIIKWKNEIPIEFRPIPSLKDELQKYDKQHGIVTPTYRYYFLMPNGNSGKKGDINEEWNFKHYGKYADSWYNEYTNQAGIYWWDADTINPTSWPGYTIEKADAEGIFYADVPQTVETVIFNNALDSGLNSMNDLYYKGRQSSNVPCYVDEDWGEYFPVGAQNFDNMIFVMNPSLNNENDLVVGPVKYGGEWYYYYGNGCYGETKDGDTDDCLRDDHEHGAKYICRDEFIDYCNITDDDSFMYTGPLYYHYDKNGNKKWFLAKGECGFSELVNFYGIFGDYLLYENAVYSPAQFPYYIYSYDEQKFYSLEEAWSKDIDGLDMVFTDYLCPTKSAYIIGDADNDNKLSVMDATTIQMAQAGTIKLYDNVYGKCYYGNEISCRNDVDRDGERSVLDATAIQMKLAYLI